MTRSLAAEHFQWLAPELAPERAPEPESELELAPAPESEAQLHYQILRETIV